VRFAVHEELRPAMNPERIHFFDVSSDRAI
jgi:hypothetical protein